VSGAAIVGTRNQCNASRDMLQSPFPPCLRWSNLPVSLQGQDCIAASQVLPACTIKIRASPADVRGMHASQKSSSIMKHC
jgi:hypothetical protein